MRARSWQLWLRVGAVPFAYIVSGLLLYFSALNPTTSILSGMMAGMLMVVAGHAGTLEVDPHKVKTETETESKS